MDSKTFIAEIKSDLSRYDQAGMIDEISIYGWMEDALKKFGKLLCVLADTIVPINHGSGCLPSDFYSFKFACLCEPLGYTTKGDKADLQHEFAWIERTERGHRWNSCEECCKEEFESVITEKLYIKNTEVDFHYHNLRLLNLGSTIKSKIKFDKCPFDAYAKETINIDSNRIFANFDSGNIYLQYYATPKSEDGTPFIPDTELGDLHLYVLCYVKRCIFEKLFANGDDPNVVNKLQYYLSQEPGLQQRAMGELKMAQMGPDVYERMVRKNRSNIEVFSKVIPPLGNNRKVIGYVS